MCVSQLVHFSLKIGKVGYFVKFSKHLYQNWWTSSHEPVSKIGHKKISKICLWVCQLVHWFTLWININISVPCWSNWLELSTFVLVKFFSAYGDWLMMIKVTVTVIGLGTIVTWLSCRPLVLFTIHNIYNHPSKLPIFIFGHTC